MPPLDSARVRAILFDLDGTLADTDDTLINGAVALLSPLKWLFARRDPLPFVRWGVMRSEGAANFLMTVPDRLGVDAPLARLTSKLRGDRPSGQHHFEMIAGVDAMLATLSERYPLAIVSTRNADGTNQFLEQFAFHDYFQIVVTALTAPRRKPHPAPVLYAAQALGVPPEHCLMVGDTTMDVLAGKRAGAQTVGVLCGFGARGELARAGANLILNMTPEVVEYL